MCRGPTFWERRREKKIKNTDGGDVIFSFVLEPPTAKFRDHSQNTLRNHAEPGNKPKFLAAKPAPVPLSFLFLLSQTLLLMSPNDIPAPWLIGRKVTWELSSASGSSCLSMNTNNKLMEKFYAIRGVKCSLHWTQSRGQASYKLIVSFVKSRLFHRALTQVFILLTNRIERSLGWVLSTASGLKNTSKWTCVDT